MERNRVSKTLFDRIWDDHVVVEHPGRPPLLYADLHLVHEVSSPQAFEGLRQHDRSVRRPDQTLATEDHIIPTRGSRIDDPVAAEQLRAIRENCSQFGVQLCRMGSGREGIVHVIAPELGLTQPGMFIVCGDSHTSTHGAFGAFAMGIGTSAVEHVLTTQCLPLLKPRTMRVHFEGKLPNGVVAKDAILSAIACVGAGGGAGHVIEYTGDLVEGLTMEGRMTVCNMSIEAGARAGLIAPDDVTFAYLEGRPAAPQGAAWDAALERWRRLRSDEDASYDREVVVDVGELVPQVSWGTNPSMTSPVDGVVPDPDALDDDGLRDQVRQALAYMDLRPGAAIQEIAIDRVFIGSCTNGRIEDLRAAAAAVQGHKVHERVRAMVVPGSAAVKRQAEQEGLDQVFVAAGFEWRNAGCSMCLAMNDDVLAPGERCASTSNRNFEGRQGKGGRTHLVSPAMAAAAAVAGHFVDVRSWS
jgi:3-isopropylmalate/(R)-2-methylmalate dehydratase large subunit